MYSPKALLTTAVILSSLLILGCKKQSHVIESELFTCIKDVSKSNEIDLAKELNDYERVLIEFDVLSDSTGDAYFKLYQSMAKGTTIEFPNYKPNFLDMYSFLPCYMMLMSSEKSSDIKFLKIWTEMQKADKSDNKGQSEIIIKHLSNEDFEIPFYRMVSLFSLYNFTHLNQNVPTPK